MRCKYCIFTYFNFEEGYKECPLLNDEDISENSKGEIGCRFTRKQLEKIHKEQTEQ